MTAGSKSGHSGKVRIIGGSWRGRRLPLASERIRPTPDRVRETLFNWLGPYVRSAAVLDLFAGSGALALEALSRGADRAVLVEKDAAHARHLGSVCSELGAAEARVLSSDTYAMLAAANRGEPFDIVFMDPPFADGRVAELCAALAAGNWLSNGALVYIEQDINDELPELPSGWVVRKQKTAGQVSYLLVSAENAGEL